MPQALRDYLSRHHDEMIRDLRTLVGIESPSDDRGGLERAVEWTAAAFRDALGPGPLGSPVIERLPGHPTADHLRVRIDPGRHGSAVPGVLLLAHIDTVWPVGTLERLPFRIQNGQAYGPGGYDMKGGIIIALWAFRALTALERVPRRPVTLLINTDEETGSTTSRRHIEDLARQSAAVLVLEPARPDGSVKTWRKGVGHFHLEVRGRAAHAGADPEQGVSAIEELAVHIRRLHQMTDHATGTTVNVGRIGGGTRSNVVADLAWADVDVRVKSRAEAERITRAIHALAPELPGAALTVTGAINRLPMERTEGTLALYRQARDLAAELGFDLGETGTGGASDGNFTSALGIPTLDGLGAVGDGAHADHEQVDIASLPTRAALLAAMLL